jgi:FtsH-binding integral membrane protein
MLIYSLLGWFMGSAGGLGFIMVGLFVACLYIIYDTQMIVEQSERGDRDVPSHTMKLFFDLFDLFIKIVRVLLELQ